VALPVAAQRLSWHTQVLWVSCRDVCRYMCTSCTCAAGALAACVPGFLGKAVLLNSTDISTVNSPDGKIRCSCTGGMHTDGSSMHSLTVACRWCDLIMHHGVAWFKGASVSRQILAASLNHGAAMPAPNIIDVAAMAWPWHVSAVGACTMVGCARQLCRQVAAASNSTPQ
jgi:hypothetical protein